MLELLSLRIAKKLRAMDPKGTVPIPVMAYELGFRLNFRAALALTALLGWASGELMYSLISFFTFVLMRKFSGGLHMESLTACAIISALIFSMIPQINVAPAMVFIFTAISTIIYGIYAPNFTTESIPSTSPVLCKIITVTLCLANFVIASPVLALTFLVQAVLILPIVQKTKGVTDHEINTKNI
ncbi:accessory gene regulator B family protein [Paenibacillus amylolyticus]|uniref:Accessory gene regulator B family protein n=1 Tax=Paenibacillus amylolyticus TaxID=1451 RepID=A0ABD8B3L1_PAEAM